MNGCFVIDIYFIPYLHKIRLYSFFETLHKYFEAFTA